MKFYSKIDVWFLLLFGVFLYTTGALTHHVLCHQTPILICVVICLWLLQILALIPIYLNTYYEIQDEVLVIRSGIFYRAEIPYSAIQKLAPSKKILPLGYLSLDRLELIYYGPWHRTYTMLISPKNKEEFIKQVQKKNPNIDTNCGKSDFQPIQEA